MEAPSLEFKILKDPPYWSVLKVEKSYVNNLSSIHQVHFWVLLVCKELQKCAIYNNYLQGDWSIGGDRCVNTNRTEYLYNNDSNPVEVVNGTI